MNRLIAIAFALLALPAGALAGQGASSSGARSPWFFGLSVSPEGFGADSGLGAGENLYLGLCIDPCPWRIAVPSVATGFSIPLFPWDPKESLFEARLDLRLATLRLRFLDSLYDGPSEYAPSLSASAYWPLSGGGIFAAFGARPFVFRTGDAVYSFLSVSTIFTRGADPGAPYAFRSFSIELFEFTHFFM